jgi:hypothetical protein
MKFIARFIGMTEVKLALKALPVKLQKQIISKAMTKSTKVAVKAIRQELSSGYVFDALKILSKPNRAARKKAKTEKGRISAAARMSRSELKKSIGVRKVKRSKMRDKNIIFHAVGPRAFFKVTNIRTPKRMPYAANTVAKMLERGTSFLRPTAYTRRAMRQCKGPYKDAMIEAARAAIKKAKAKMSESATSA